MSMKREEFEARIIAKAQQDSAFYEALKKDPKGVLQKELQEVKAGVTLPDSLKVSLVEESPEQIYLRLPFRSDSLSDAELSSVAGGAGRPGGQDITVAMQIDVTAVVAPSVVTSGSGGVAVVVATVVIV